MSNGKKPIRGWGETPRPTGTMRDLRALRPPEPPSLPAEVKPVQPAPSAPTETAPTPETTPAPRPQIAVTPSSLPEPAPLLVAAGTPIKSFEEFRARWKPVLRKGQMMLCEVLYSKTHAIGRESCTTSFSELASLSGLQIRQCFNVIAQLEALKFVERERTSKGSNKTSAGSIFRFYLLPQD